MSIADGFTTTAKLTPEMAAIVLAATQRSSDEQLVQIDPNYLHALCEHYLRTSQPDQVQAGAWLRMGEDYYETCREDAPGAFPVYRAAPSDGAIDVEAMLRECVPGGSSCDPQQVADNIRAYFEHRAREIAEGKK